MTAPPQPEAPKPKPTVRWDATELRDAERIRLLILLFGPRAAERLDPGNG